MAAGGVVLCYSMVHGDVHPHGHVEKSWRTN
jgi:hypothetical protein